MGVALAEAEFLGPTRRRFTARNGRAGALLPEGAEGELGEASSG